MKTNEDIEKKIEYLKKVGSPSALSKARELEWVLGLSEDSDDEADMLVDSLIGSLSKGPSSLWEKVPEFARNHVLYKFGEKWDREAEWAKMPPRPARNAPWKEQMAYREALNEFNAKAALNNKQAEGFSWRDLIGAEAHNTAKKLFGAKGWEEVLYTSIPHKSAEIGTADLISSEDRNGKHRPLLDIDFPAAVIPSTTPGHCHLYIDKELSWKDYKKLLNVLAELGIIEHGYRGASIARGYTALRLPWVKKQKDDEEISIEV